MKSKNDSVEDAIAKFEARTSGIRKNDNGLPIDTSVENVREVGDAYVADVTYHFKKGSPKRISYWKKYIDLLCAAPSVNA